MRYIALFLIKFYIRFISPMLPRRCRFYPSCSQYSLLAVEKYGIFKGVWLSIFRLSRCHPWNQGGYDPLL